MSASKTVVYQGEQMKLVIKWEGVAYKFPPREPVRVPEAFALHLLSQEPMDLTHKRPQTFEWYVDPVDRKRKQRIVPVIVPLFKEVEPAAEKKETAEPPKEEETAGEAVSQPDTPRRAPRRSNKRKTKDKK